MDTTTVECINCGCSFQLPMQHIGQGEYFCSQECMHDYEESLMLEEDNE